LGKSLKDDQKPLVDGHYLLSKFPGKGGWTYALIPEITPSGRIPFGWVRVSGAIDAYEINRYKLMPNGNGQLFLPVKAAIRRSIGKDVGDQVHVVLFSDDYFDKVPDEIIACFRNEPSHLYTKFQSLKQQEQNDFLNWIYDAKSDEQKAERIVKMMEKLKNGIALYSKN